MVVVGVVVLTGCCFLLPSLFGTGGRILGGGRLLLKMLSLLPCPEPGLFCCCCCCLPPPTLAGLTAGAAAPSYQTTKRQRVKWNAHEWSLKFIRIRSTLLKMGSSLFWFLSLFLSYMTSSKISNRNDEFLIDVEFLIEIKRHNCEFRTFFFF